MNIDQKRRLLADSIGLLPAALYEVFVTDGTYIRAAPRRMIISDRDMTNDLYFIVSGSVDITLYTDDGREVALGSLGRGEAFGELAAIDGRSRSATVGAATSCELIRLDQSRFIALAESDPELAMWLARRLASMVRRLTQRVYERTALNVQNRIHAELWRLVDEAMRSHGVPKVDPAPSHAELANRVGTHREAVTRELNVLSSKAIISHGRKKLEVIDFVRFKQSVRHHKQI